jgi:cytidylate kinase|tara:strand:+ start:325 stop:996 length:672 start_codon:yes stop_codon:yes gene_type:complete
MKINKKFNFSIAVDGGSASGKTFGSKIISKEFNFKLLSSGKLYRYLAYQIIKNRFKYNKNYIRKLSKNISTSQLNSSRLYSVNVTKLASIIAKKKYVRSYLKKFQLDFIKNNAKVIVEGRDIASKIMPSADLKIFFKCSQKEKAMRRYLELKKINKKIELEDVKKALKLRDFNDKNRKQSPLLFVRGAVLVDTTNLTKKQVKVKLIKLVKKEIRLKKKKYGNL